MGLSYIGCRYWYLRNEGSVAWGRTFLYSGRTWHHLQQQMQVVTSKARTPYTGGQIYEEALLMDGSLTSKRHYDRLS